MPTEFPTTSAGMPPGPTDSGGAAPTFGLAHHGAVHNPGDVPGAGHARPSEGVTALPSAGAEPVGPEDALGPGPKRGDYADRVGVGDDGQPQVHTRVEAVPESALQKDEAGNVLSDQPVSQVQPQNHEVHNVGDVPGEKGGVTTTAADVPATDGVKPVVGPSDAAPAA